MTKFLSRSNFSHRRHSTSLSQFINPLEALTQANMPIRSTLQTAQLFAHIRQELNLFLQNDVGSYCHVVRLDAEQLILAVPNAAIASKLRQLAPSIASYLAQKGYTISRLNIKVSAELQRLMPKNTISKHSQGHTSTNPRVQQCHQAFQTFVQQYPDSPLAPSIHKFLQTTKGD
ncbi:DciA family protein [Pelistega europaea]|uniref:DUF721 domain-containing protein n=1 Tax=Pelistega europaea TaxID=106147 RepID=A0A7Y4P5U7_9BURK|nr:DciA family protein [Pelistega europaea]NOL49229.1 DUF721 domain-containing protein [Pelistega europaea]